MLSIKIENVQTIEKKNGEAKTWLFEKFNKIDKHPPDLSRKETKWKFWNIRNWWSKIITEPTDTQRIKREYYVQIFAIKFNNINKMSKFHEGINQQNWHKKK